MKTKSCTRCKLELSVDKFYKDKAKKDGLFSWCKKCWSKYTLNYSITLDGRVAQMYSHMKIAVKSGRVSSKDFISRRYFAELCNKSDTLKELIANWPNHKFSRKYAPSVDRINNKLGYTKDNIQFITQGENAAKGSLERDTERELKGEYKLPTATHKWCNDCKSFLPISKFSKDMRTSCGLAWACNACKSERNKLYRERINNK